MIKLTYIIPLYNSARWLRKCLDSVLNQDIPEEEVEIICINDGSPDESGEIARSYQKEHTCVVVIDQENEGPSGARNNGMRHARGKYLAFVDPDDFVEPNVYGGLVKQMGEENLDMLRFNFQMVDENYKVIGKPLAETLFDYTPELMSGSEFLGKRLDGACNIWRYIYRTEIITKNEIWCYKGDYYDDTPWLPLVLMKAKRMNVCNTIAYNYFERSDSLVQSRTESSIDKKIKGTMFLLETLQGQVAKIDALLPNESMEKKEGVRRWYDKMETYSSIGLISSFAQYRFGRRKECLTFLKKNCLLPLKGDNLVPKAERKKNLINVCPSMFIWILKIKSLTR